MSHLLITVDARTKLFLNPMSEKQTWRLHEFLTHLSGQPFEFSRGCCVYSCIISNFKSQE